MSILLNISSTDATNVTSTTQYSYTFTQWQLFCSMKLVNVCIPNVHYNITSGNITITTSGTTYTISLGSCSNSVLLALLNSTISGTIPLQPSGLPLAAQQALLLPFLKVSSSWVLTQHHIHSQ